MCARCLLIKKNIEQVRINNNNSNPNFQMNVTLLCVNCYDKINIYVGIIRT